jgi:hypothetical protein
MNVGVRFGRTWARSMASLLVITAVGLTHGEGSPVGAQPGAADVVTVQTIPPIAGVDVQLGQERGVTGPEGFVALSVPSRDQAIGDVVVHTRDVAVHDRQRARYSRVMGTNGRLVQLAFDVDYAVDLSFVDRGGKAVEPGLIDSMTIKSALGERRKVERAGETMWLHGSRVISTANGPQVRPILWSIEEVSVSGATVVRRAANRFEPALAAPAPIELLFFSADFTVRDALLGTVAGTSVDLRFPNGQVRQYSLDAEGRVRIERLPRGDYHVVVNGSGPVLSRPVSITRDQEVELKFYTWNDVSLAGVVLAFCIGGPIALGRRLRRRRRSSEDGLDAVPDDDALIDLVTIERAMSAKRAPSVNVETANVETGNVETANVADLRSARAGHGAGSDNRGEGRSGVSGVPEHDFGHALWWHVHAFRLASSSRRRWSWRGTWVIAVLDELSGHCLAAQLSRRRGERELLAVVEDALGRGAKAEPALPVVVFLPANVGSVARLILVGGDRTHVELRHRYRAEHEIASLQQWRRCVEEEVGKARGGTEENASTAHGALPDETLMPALSAAMAQHNLAYPNLPGIDSTAASSGDLISSGASAALGGLGDAGPAATPGR